MLQLLISLPLQLISQLFVTITHGYSAIPQALYEGREVVRLLAPREPRNDHVYLSLGADLRVGEVGVVLGGEQEVVVSEEGVDGVEVQVAAQLMVELVEDCITDPPRNSISYKQIKSSY